MIIRGLGRPSQVNPNNVRLLVKGLVEIGDRLDLQIFTSSNGAALLDWSATEHRVLTVWAHESGAELRAGASVHALLPLEGPTDLARVLGLVEQVVTGSWFETYVVDPRTGEVDPLRWQIGNGSLPSLGSPGGARQPSDDARIHRQGVRWGPGAGAAIWPPA